CIWLKRLEAERFKTKPDAGDMAIELTSEEQNLLLGGIDPGANLPHQVLTPRFVACASMIRRHYIWRPSPSIRSRPAQADVAVGARKSGATPRTSCSAAPQVVLAQVRAQP